MTYRFLRPPLDHIAEADALIKWGLVKATEGASFRVDPPPVPPSTQRVIYELWRMDTDRLMAVHKILWRAMLRLHAERLDPVRPVYRAVTAELSRRNIRHTQIIRV